MKNKKGQLSIIGIVLIFATVVVFVGLYPALSNTIGNLTATSGDSTLNMVVSLIPLFMTLGIVITLFAYVTPYRPQ